MVPLPGSLLESLGPACPWVLLAVLTGAPQDVAPAGRERSGAIEVPLVPMPGAPVLGLTVAASFLDFDADGWIDLYVHYSGRLWRNQEGRGFVLAADLDAFLPRTVGRYGASCADYDGDGLADIACEPRADCLYVLRNLDGAGSFQEIARDPALLLDPPGCFMLGETFCWADVDDDGDLDLWATAYPSSVVPGSGGNQFLENLGPTGPGGAYRFRRATDSSGLGNPPEVSRPEGAQFVDVDRDGDLDAFANGTLYRNVTDSTGARFVPLVGAPVGLTLVDRLDEGVLFLDYDLDGDQDLLVVYHPDIVLWENRGDGTFFQADDALDQPGVGDRTGCSAEDWDLDGDLDLTTAGTFRRNLLMETGTPFLRIASEALPPASVSSPAWGDWDRDGDLDCVLSNHDNRGLFYENTTYGPDTPAARKRSVRVRPVRNSERVERGLETEFGATVELRVHDDPSGFVRRRFVASSHGYLQQSEYALTLALPPAHALQATPSVLFDLVVDFPSLPANGIVRIGPAVNPVLGALSLETLAAHEVTVFRSGLVRIGGIDHPPRPEVETRLFSSGCLAEPAPGAPLERPATVAEPWLVGLELDTSDALDSARLEELVLDGQLAPPAPGHEANVILLDVTGGEPRRVVQETRATAPRNDRSFLPLDWPLEPGHRYRLLCRVTALRASPLAAGRSADLMNRGALACPAAGRDDRIAAEAELDPTRTWMELRYRPGRSRPDGRRRGRAGADGAVGTRKQP